MSAALRDHVQRECVEALKRVGFVELKKGWPIKPINADFRCWVGLNFGVHRGSVSLNPNVGVHVEKLDRRMAELGADPKLKYCSTCATYSETMGQLAPHEQPFDFFDGYDVSQTAERLAALYADVGFQFSRSISSYAALLPLLHERTPWFGGFPQRYALCLYELGRRDEAMEYVSNLSEEAEHLKTFCLNFVEFCRKTAS